MKEKFFFAEHMHKGSAKFMVLTCCSLGFLGLFILNVFNGSPLNSRPGISDGKQMGRSEISEVVCLNVACEPMPREGNSTKFQGVCAHPTDTHVYT